ncbi:MAG TPA: HAD family hydrolase [Solirubrobacterales bacterium]|nr:HAD family hydrolase [Solirubrobacterales bacterium]
MATAAVLDVDGTLVDTNYHHAIAWYRAFRRHGVTLPVWRIHRHIGMGGDQLVAALCGDEVETRLGDAVRESEGGLYMDLIDEVQPLEGARELIAELGEHADRVVLASSAKQDEVDHYLDLLDARELADAWTTSADVESTKPEPDLVRAALEAVEADSGLMIGDTTWDCEAAGRAGLPAVAVMTGGFSERELRDADAVAVFESLGELRAALPELPVIGAAGPRRG